MFHRTNELQQLFKQHIQAKYSWYKSLSVGFFVLLFRKTAYRYLNDFETL